MFFLSFSLVNISNRDDRIKQKITDIQVIMAIFHHFDLNNPFQMSI